MKYEMQRFGKRVNCLGLSASSTTSFLIEPGMMLALSVPN